jgi:hypothetical protein
MPDESTDKVLNLFAPVHAAVESMFCCQHPEYALNDSGRANALMKLLPFLPSKISTHYDISG